MQPDKEILDFLHRHLEAIRTNDVQAYRKTTADDLTLYEWWVTPHRLDGIPFHEFMMEANASRGAVFGAAEQQSAPARFDLSNLHIQRYGDMAVASYTLLVSTQTGQGVRVASHNESRVIVRLEGEWKVVHCHKSPAWNAPHLPPSG